MTRKPKINSHATYHFWLPTLAIGGLSFMLVAGLAALGVLDHVNAEITRLVSRGGLEKFPKHLPRGADWLAGMVVSFAIAAAILGTPGHLRRFLLWITSVVLVGAWAPALSLAAHAPEIAVPWIACIWSGVCAMVYAANHPTTESLTHSKKR